MKHEFLHDALIYIYIYIYIEKKKIYETVIKSDLYFYRTLFETRIKREEFTDFYFIHIHEFITDLFASKKVNTKFYFEC